MTEPKLDRRVVRTRRLLSKALMELILENEKGYDGVTVQDIAERANVGRATFYLHYKGGKEELLVSNLEAIYDDLVERIKPFKSDLASPNRHHASQTAFEHAAEQRDLYLVLLRGQGAAAITQRIRQYLAGVIQEDLEEMGAVTSIPIEIVATHMAGSLVTLITWWLENDMPHSAEYMAETFSQLTMSGVGDVRSQKDI